eukprot:COSAG06_NODE_502_length_14953_cov_15.585297_4_plen_169_part_00
MVGLTDHDLNVHDDQSLVITDYYSEQIKNGHVYLSGAAVSTQTEEAGAGSDAVAAGGGGGRAGTQPGRVTIAAAKSDCYTPDEMTVDNYHGTIAYSNSFFFEGPPVVITQRGAVEVNITLWCVQTRAQLQHRLFCLFCLDRLKTSTEKTPILGFLAGQMLSGATMIPP